MRHIAAYVVFAVVYGGQLLLAGFAADQLNSKALEAAMPWAAPFATAPFALLIAMRLGYLSNLGIAVTSFMLGVCACVATVGILVAAVPIVGEPTFEYVIGMFASYFIIGGWKLALGFILLVAAPLLWSISFLGRRLPVTRAAA